MKKSLILGPTGKIGGAVTQYLHNNNHPFIAYVRDPKKKALLKQKGISCTLGDYTDHSTLKKSLKAVQQLFLVVTPDYHMAEQELSIIDLAKEAGIEFILKISVIGASIDSDVHLGKAHGIVEQHLKESQIPYTLFRPHSFMQNILASLYTIKNQGAIYNTLGPAQVPLIDTRDIGEASGKILMHPEKHINQTYTLTGPEAISMDRAANIISDAIGHQVNYVDVPESGAREGMLQSGVPEWLADDLLTMNRRWRNGNQVSVTDDLKLLLGKNPRSFESFIADNVSLFT